MKILDYNFLNITSLVTVKEIDNSDIIMCRIKGYVMIL